MDEKVEYDTLEDSLRRCGASWDAAQAHGLLTGRLAILGVPAGPEWLLQVLEGVDENNASRNECQKHLDTLYQLTFWQLSERLSEFEPILPGDSDDVGVRTAALAHWCEGFLHGLVSTRHSDELKERLGAAPFSDIIKDMLQITRAGLDEESDQEENEAAFVELVEYLRVAAQLCYEELADIRNIKSDSKQAGSDE
jgi:yecA family protein